MVALDSRGSPGRARISRFYHLLAENAESEYIAYVSEQKSPWPMTSVSRFAHSQVAEISSRTKRGGYRPPQSFAELKLSIT